MTAVSTDSDLRLDLRFQITLNPRANLKLGSQLSVNLSVALSGSAMRVQFGDYACAVAKGE
jgi:hypothetical protein